MRRFLQALRPLQTLSLTPVPAIPAPLRLLSSSSSAAASSDSDSAPAPAPAADADFDSAEYDLPTPGPAPSRKVNNPVSALRKLRFDPALRARADEALFGEARGGAAAVGDEDEERSRDVALALLDAAMEPPDEEDEDPGEVREEDQMSLSVGIVGAPNAGKSSLTNTMVWTTSERRLFFLFDKSFKRNCDTG